MKKTLASEYPEIAKEWHPTKNGDVTPSDVSPHSEKTAWWLCENGHEWESPIKTRTRPRGCPYCANRRAWKGDNDLASQYPDVASQWHPTKNGGLTPDQVVATTTKSVWWKCEHGHEWMAPVEKRTLRGHGCHQCSNQVVTPGDNDLISKRPDLARLFYHELNADIDLEGLAWKSSKKVWWKCENGYDHPYTRSVYRQVEADGRCPHCSNRRVLPGFNDLQHAYPELMGEWDYDKNDKMPYEVGTNSKYRAHWKCSEGHSWQASVESRTSRGRASVCPECHKHGTSFAEQSLIFYVSLCYDGEIQESAKIVPGRNYEVDIFLPDKSLAIEYNGTYWHKDKLAVDTEKRDLLREIGIEVIYVLEPSGLPIEGSESFTMKSDDIVDHEEACRWVLNRLGIDIQEVDIDIKRDKLDIMRRYKTKSMTRQFSHKHPELLEIWDYPKNNVLELYPYLFDTQGDVSVWWSCPNCGEEWEATVKSEIATGGKCPGCDTTASEVYQHNEKLRTKNADQDVEAAIGSGKFSVSDMMPEIAQLWDAKKNAPLEPSDIAYNSRNELWWVCDDGHSFKATPRGLANGTEYCPYCAGDRECNTLSLIRPDLAGRWHPTKNGSLTPDDVTCGSNAEVWWTCSDGHEFKAKVSSVSKEGYGCPVCSGQQVDPDTNSLQALRPDIAELWDFEKNHQFDPAHVTAGSSKAAWWVCENGCADHGYEAPIKQMTSKQEGNYCPYCSNTLVKTGFNDLATVAPHIAAQWDHAKNGNLKPVNVLSVSTKKAHWVCECGYEWEAEIGSRVKRASGCPSCAASLNARRTEAQRKMAEESSILDIACDDPSGVCAWDADRVNELYRMIGIDSEIIRKERLYLNMDIEEMADRVFVPIGLMREITKMEGVMEVAEEDVAIERAMITAFDGECQEKGGISVDDLIKARILDKKGVPELAKALGCSKSWLNKMVVKLGVSKRKHVTDREKLSVSREWLVTEHCKNHRSYRSIAEELGVNDEIVARACEQYRIPYLGGIFFE